MKSPIAFTLSLCVVLIGGCVSNGNIEVPIVLGLGILIGSILP